MNTYVYMYIEREAALRLEGESSRVRKQLRTSHPRQQGLVCPPPRLALRWFLPEPLESGEGTT